MTDINADAALVVSSTHSPMKFREFVVVIASIMALNPMAMDIMLPALPHLGAAFKIADANRLQTVLSVFLLGFGVAQFAIGPLSDRYRPPPRPARRHGRLLRRQRAGADRAVSFELLLLARLLQGLGTAATRVIAVSIVRRLLGAGGRMAGVMSLAMMVFIAVPVIAPSFGQALMLLTEWRGIFVVLTLYGVLALAWSACAHAGDARRSPNAARSRIRDVLLCLSADRQPIGRRSAMALAAGGSCRARCSPSSSSRSRCSPKSIISAIISRWPSQPLRWASPLPVSTNARFVNRLGMRVISHGALLGYRRGWVARCCWRGDAFACCYCRCSSRCRC